MFRRGTTRRWSTTERIDWHLYAKNSGILLSIEPGFEFESSVPRWAQWLISPDDPRLLLAACVHDHLLERYGARPFPAAGEWHDAAKKGGYPRPLLLALGVVIWTVWKRP